MAEIVLSRGVRNNLLALQQTSALIATTQTRLATGRKVNTSLDDPLTFFLSSSFQARAKDLQFLLDGMSNAAKTLETADKGITNIQKLVESAEVAARQALQTDRTTAGVTGTVTGLTGTSQFVVAATRTVTVSDGTTTVTYTTGSTFGTVQGILDAVNNNAVINIRASLTGGGAILLEARTTNVITIAGSVLSTELDDVGLVAGTTAAGTLNTSRSGLATNFNNIRTQIDTLAADASFNNVSLLNLEGLKVVFNEQGTSSMSISGVNATATGLSVSAAVGTFQTDFDINAAITQTTAAVTTLKGFATSFAVNLQVIQARQDFTNELIVSLKDGAEALVLADTNEEGANLLALQTRQQLSSTALALAAQNDQAILRLFG
jgi:flagellin